jgi:hypothetical protein
LSPLERAALVKTSSVDVVTVAVEAGPRERARPLVLGGGVTKTSRRSVGPLETVTGEPSPPRGVAPTSDSPKPRPGRLSRARRTALVNSASRSVIEVVRRKELLRLGAITRGSPGYRYAWFATVLSSAARRKEVRRVGDPTPLEPASEWKSDRSGMLSIGGRNVVDREPDPDEAPDCALDSDWMVRIEPTGEPVAERSGIEIE